MGPGLGDPGTRDPGSPQSLKVEPQDPLQNFKVGPQEPLQSLKNGTFVITFLHCYICNMEIIFLE